MTVSMLQTIVRPIDMKGGSGFACEGPAVVTLLPQLCRAERGDQRAVLLFLVKKSPSEIGELSQVDGGVESYA